ARPFPGARRGRSARGDLPVDWRPFHPHFLRLWNPWFQRYTALVPEGEGLPPDSRSFEDALFAGLWRGYAFAGPAQLLSTAASTLSSAAVSTTGARLETCSPSRRRITITPWVARPERLMSSTGMRMTVPPSEISITW